MTSQPKLSHGFRPASRVDDANSSCNAQSARPAVPAPFSSGCAVAKAPPGLKKLEVARILGLLDEVKKRRHEQNARCSTIRTYISIANGRGE